MSFTHLWNRVQLTGRRRARLYRKLATLIDNGVRLQDALLMLYDQASRKGKRAKDPIPVALAEWLDGLRRGVSLGEAVRAWVPAQEQLLLVAGERTEHLAGMLRSMADSTEASSRINSAVFGRMFYPVMLWVAVAVFLWLYGVKIVPQVESAVSAEKWTGVAASMRTMSVMVRSYGVYLVAGALATVALVLLAMPRWTGRARGLLDRVLPFSIYRFWAGSGFLIALAALVKAGTRVAPALHLLSVTASPWMQERTLAILSNLGEGDNLGEAMDRTGFRFPDQDIIDDLTIYARFSGLDKALSTIGDDWLTEGVKRVEAQFASLQTASIVLVGMVVLWLTLGILAIGQLLAATANVVK